MPRNVAVVFDPDFGGELERLAFHTPVWIVETPENRVAAELAWQSAVEWPHITVTLFRSQDEWRTLLEQIRFQEKAFDSVDVIGAPLTDAVRAALAELGFDRFDETQNGFRARRSS